MERPYEKRRPKSDFDVHKTGTSVFEAESVFPHAFVPIREDSSLPGFGKILHTDGVGSKLVQSYLVWKETGDITVFEGLADDVVAMNLNDIFCAGPVSDIEFVDYVAINRFTLPKEEFLKTLNAGFQRVFHMLAGYGIQVSFLGGETAEVSDQMRTAEVSAAVRARIRLQDVIAGDKVAPGDVIIGLGSYDKAVWEQKENTGIMCNGFAVARHSLMNAEYAAKYPEIADPKAMEYKGRFKTDQFLEELGMTVGEALISPTRIFAPVLKSVIEKYGPENIHGMVHNTGGGLTKCLRTGKEIHYVKDALLPIPPIFSLIQRESERTWQSVFEGLNNGIGVEIMAPENFAPRIIEEAAQFHVPAAVIGRCESNTARTKLASKHGNRLTIISQHGTFEYPYEEVR